MNSILDSIPEISFIDDLTIDEIMQQMLNDYQMKYEEITGKSMELTQANPYRLILYACSMQVYQTLMYLDIMGKQNLLKYSEGTFLDQIGALRHVKRLEGSYALTTIRFSVASERAAVTAIPQGTRVAAGEIFFETKEYAEVAAGELSVDVPAQCTDIGENGNNLMPGEISTIVDSVPFISSAVNITTSNSGSDVESDDNFAERIYLAPSSYSVAGPEDAYSYLVKECNSSIADVKVYSEKPMQVDIRFIMNDGKLPSEEIQNEVSDFLNSKTRRPLTDKVVVAAPDIISYDIDVKYWIAESSKSVANAIQTAVEQAVTEYKTWQDSKIGRDINPSELIYRIKEAGAKRVEVTDPVFTVTDNSKIPQNTSIKLTYGGIEDD